MSTSSGYQQRRPLNIPCAFGATLKHKSNGHMRILAQNIDGIPKQAGKAENEKWTARLKQYEVDLTLFSEINMNWPQTRASESLQNRLKQRWKNSRTTLGYNTHAKHIQSKHLQGGTACISFDSAASRSSDAGSDQRGLGRWSWQRIKGPNNSHITLISAYAPARSGNDGLSVMAQQRTYFSNQDDDRDPKQIFFSDLGEFINSLVDDGSHVVLGLDANVDTEGDKFKNWLEKTRLINPLLERYGPCPNTYIGGSRPIDALLTTQDFPYAQGGMIPPKDLLDSDHCGIWLDFDPGPIIGNVHFEPISQPRRLSTRNAKALKEYIRLYDAYAKEHDLAKRATTILERAVNEGISKNLLDEINEIDHVRWQGMTEADSKCRKLRMGRQTNSPNLSQLYKDKRLISIRIKQALGRAVSSSTIRRARSKAEIRIPANATAKDLRNLMRKYEVKIIKAKRNADDSNDEHLHAQAEVLASIDDKPTSTHLARLRGNSYSRKIFSQIRQCLKPTRHQATSFSTILPNGEEVEAFDKEGMEDLALREGEKRFRQTEDNPFMREPLRNDLGLKGDGPAIRDVLKGTFRPEYELPDEIWKLILTFKRKQHIAEVPAEITSDEWVRLWNRSRETTACGDSGLHFALFKANCKHPRLLAIDVAIANACYKTGCTLERWKRSINVFLPKSIGTNRVEKHRIIHLWEADANGIFKILSRQAQQSADKHGLIAPEQFGSRKEHSAIALSLAKRLTFDIARQRRQTTAFCCNDAKQCYDRMIHTPSALALRRIGMAAEPVECMFGMLQSLRHYAKTAHGISMEFFSTTVSRQEADPMLPVQGIGQGNGGGPTIWAVLSSTVLDSIRSERNGLQTVAPISDSRNIISNMALVDDTDTIEGARTEDDDAEKVIGRLQLTTNAWIEGVRATGGDVNASKTFWSLIDFEFPRGKKPKYVKSEKAPGELYVRENGQEIKLKRLEPHESLLTLGVMLTPDGNERDQVRRMQNQVREWVAKIRRRKLPKEVLETALRCTIERTLSYPTAVTTLSKEECRSITAPLRQTMLSLLGFNRNTPQVVAEATRDNGGLGIIDLYAEQISQRNVMMVKYGGSNTITGKQIRCSTEILKLELGNGMSLSTCKASDWAFLATDSWVKQTWLDNEEAGISINDPTPDLSLLSIRDSFINNVAHELGMSETERAGVNQCRMFLRVSTVAEICTADGTRVRPEMHLWHRGEAPTGLDDRWPRQRAPNGAETRAWKKMLHAIASGRTSVELPLGKWYYNLCTKHHRMDLYDFTQTFLYKRQKDQWERWKAVSGHRANRLQSTIFKEKRGSTRDPPTQRCRPTRARNKKKHITMEKTRARLPRPTDPESFEEYLGDLRKHKRWACQDVRGHQNSHAIAEAIRAGTAIGVSDGSFKDGRSASAWVIKNQLVEGETAFQQRAIYGYNLIPGQPAIQDSCRAELGGIAGILYAVEAVCKMHRITNGKIEIGLDGLSAIQLCDFSKLHTQNIDNHHDLCNDLISTIKQLPVQVTFRHVRGHQDEITTAELDPWERLNVEMDEESKKYRQTPLPHPGNHVPFGSVHFSAISSRGAIAKNLRRVCRKLAQERNIREYWRRKFDWTIEKQHSIAWDARDEAARTTHPSTRRFVIQHATGFSAAGSRMAKRGVNDVTCPFCHDSETERHVFGCMSDEATQHRQTAIAALKEKLKKLQTPYRLQQTIEACVQPAVSNFQKAQQGAYETEPLQTLMGFIPERWIERYEEERREGSKQGPAWATAVILALWQLAKAMWSNRNDKHHAVEKPKEEDRKAEKRRSEIKQIWDTGRSKLRLLTLQERALFGGTIRRVLDKEESGQTGWLLCASAALRRMSRRTDREYASERMGLRIFLGLA